MPNSRYVAICGPDAAGKTTLARLLAAHLDVNCYEERPYELPELVEWLQHPSPRQLYKTLLAFLHHAATRQQAATQGGVVERIVDDNFQVFCTAAVRQKLLTRADYASLEGVSRGLIMVCHDHASWWMSYPDGWYQTSYGHWQSR